MESRRPHYVPVRIDLRALTARFQRGNPDLVTTSGAGEFVRRDVYGVSTGVSRGYQYDFAFVTRQWRVDSRRLPFGRRVHDHEIETVLLDFDENRFVLADAYPVPEPVRGLVGNRVAIPDGQFGFHEISCRRLRYDRRRHK